MNLEVSLPTAGGVVAYPPGASFGPRRMADWEFVWLLEGNAEYRWDGHIAAAPQGAFVLCRPVLGGATDFFRWDPHRPTRHAFFHFQITSPPPDWPDWPLVREAAADDLLPTLFQHVLTWQSGGDGAQTRLATGLLLAAFLSGQRAVGAVAAPEHWPPAVEAAAAYLAARLDADPAAPLTLADLAGAACVTPEHLCRLFQRALGLGPMETVRLARLDRAATLLVRSNYSVGEIAAQGGFASPFHFSRRFKAAYGLSPTDLRWRAQAGEMPPPPLLPARFALLSLPGISISGI